MANEPGPAGSPKPRQAGRSFKTYVLAAAGILMAILILQNLQEVEVRFITIETQIPLIFALLIVGALGAVVGWATPRIRRGGHD
ncbi:MAG: LapA family protein [Actinomycetota bacterium]|nr:LapA family protein [Actinomycetota bacterium]